MADDFPTHQGVSFDVYVANETLKSVEVDPRVPDNPFTFLGNWKPYLHNVSVDLLAMTGRTQAFSLGESFAEHYGLTLMDPKKVYTVEYAGKYFLLGRF
jgi:hypothetical protein